MMFKIQRRPTRVALFVRWAGYFFLLIGFLALSYCAFVLGDRWDYQAYQTRQFERALKDGQRNANVHPQAASMPLASREEAVHARSESSDVKILAGSTIGRLEINSIGLAVMVMEGMDDKTLRLAVGHIPGTPIPGQRGNVGLAAHRDTFFRGLRNIHKNDEIILTTVQGAFHYFVDSTQVVEPDDTKLLDSAPGDFLTLVTCYPFYFVGPAPRRFIVRAHRMSGGE
jgi:sortase A